MRGIAVLFVAVVALAGSAVASSRDDLASKVPRREVQRAPSSIPGFEIAQVETLIPPGRESGWHVHPARMLSTYIVETGQPIATFVDQPGQR